MKGKVRQRSLSLRRFFISAVSASLMAKTILYRLFGLGSVPKKLLPVLKQEGIVVYDEGMQGRIVTKYVNGPGKRYRHRS